MLPLSLSTGRRARLLGRTDPNAELIRYAEAWERKIHLNTPVETVRELAQRPHVPAMVTVAIRSNGSVESVTFVSSSGSPDVDEAIRRIVRSHENYAPFPPELARDFDVIEIRRTWRFDSAIRLYLTSRGQHRCRQFGRPPGARGAAVDPAPAALLPGNRAWTYAGEAALDPVPAAPWSLDCGQPAGVGAAMPDRRQAGSATCLAPPRVRFRRGRCETACDRRRAAPGSDTGPG